MDGTDDYSGKYFSDQVNVIDKLYTPCLSWATKYVRDAGYFSSHVYQVMSKQILDFILRDKNNHITLITCIDVYPSDFDALVDDYSRSEEQVFDELRRMMENENLADPVKMLAAIVATKQMTVYVSLRKREDDTPYSVDHSKSGYFSCDEKVVAFDGSINETYPAVVPGLDKGNKEHFNIYSKDELPQGFWDKFAQPIISRLDEDCKGRFPKKSAEGTIIVEIKSISRDQLPAISDEDWDPENHKARAARRSSEIYNEFEKILETNEHRERRDLFKTSALENKQIELRPHQEEGLRQWKDNNFRGILRHATGSGKTITALTAIKEHSANGLPVLILVPSRLLLEQWKDEVKAFISNVNILAVGSGYSDWKKLLGVWTLEEALEDRQRITIAINDTARTEGFAKRVSNLKNALLVVDECHRIGAQSFREICKWKPIKVLGLSATPERYDDGSHRLSELCGRVIHEYNLEDAIEDGYLTKYLYNIETVSLNYEELENYNSIKEEISEAIRKFRNKDGKIDFSKIPEWLRIKLIQAKRIIKKASEKTEVCGNIIEENYNQEKKENWLVYCEDGEQLGKVRRELIQRGISPIYEYWTGAEGAILGPQDDPKQLEFDRDGTLRLWEKEGGILLSIQCLDEGVNIPSISHGVILASSNNPRQFIQRRGRMLRLSKGKQFAHIWDALVVPDSNDEHNYNNYILGEVKRADQFSMYSFSGNAKRKLINIKSEFDISDEYDSVDIEDGGI